MIPRSPDVGLLQLRTPLRPLTRNQAHATVRALHNTAVTPAAYAKS